MPFTVCSGWMQFEVLPCADLTLPLLSVTNLSGESNSMLCCDYNLLDTRVQFAIIGSTTSPAPVFPSFLTISLILQFKVDISQHPPILYKEQDNTKATTFLSNKTPKSFFEGQDFVTILGSVLRLQGCSHSQAGIYKFWSTQLALIVREILLISNTPWSMISTPDKGLISGAMEKMHIMLGFWKLCHFIQGEFADIDFCHNYS